MRYNVHAGHAPYGTGGACGAVGILNESNEARAVKNALITLLQNSGNTVYDCTVDQALSQNGVLSAIVKKCNAHTVDLDISIHLNSGRNDYTGDGSTGGCEVYGYNTSTQNIGAKISAQIAKNLGIRDRGFKTNTSLYVLRETSAPAILIECAFVDDKDDANKWNVQKCAEAIYTGLTGRVPQSIKAAEETKANVKKWTSSLHYRVHQQSKGWDEVHQSGEVAGTTGQALRVEAIKIDYPNHKVYAKAHIQGEGWKDYGEITSDTIIGTTNQARRLECLCLKGDFKYRVHIQGTGWTAWTKADGVSTLGTVGQALRIEAIQLEEI